MALREIDQEELRQLDRMGGDGGWVLSVFLPLDLPEVPTRRVRGVELDSRLVEAEQQLREQASGEATVAVLESCLQRVRGQLDDAVVDDDAVHGVGFFCEDGGEVRAYALRGQPDFEVAACFRHGPALEPLIEAMSGPVWGVALVSRKHGRVLRGSETGLVEVGDVDDDVHRRHSQGGWSQSRYQRGIEKETKDHVRHVCDLLFALHKRQPFERIVILGPPEMWPVVEANLHPYLRERLGGHLAIDVEDASADEVLDRVRGLIAEQRRDRERIAVGRLEQGLGTGEGAVAGPKDVLAAIEDRRVETLLVGDGARDEQVERAVEGAVAQSADVLVIESDALEECGRIAALLRY
jgi:peptide chain release factor subunit 1